MHLFLYKNKILHLIESAMEPYLIVNFFRQLSFINKYKLHHSLQHYRAQYSLIIQMEKGNPGLLGNLKYILLNLFLIPANQ